MGVHTKLVSARVNRPRPITGCSTRSIVVVTNNNDNNYDDNYDVVFEILMRVDPCTIFNCIFVSKDWLYLITNPLFWKSYLNKWKKSSNSKVVGYLMHELYDKRSIAHSGVQLLATTNLGRSVNARDPMLQSRIGFFISKSPHTSRLLFCGLHPKKWYVCNRSHFSGSPPTKLPSPPAYYKSCMANILSSEDDEHFKVILARADSDFVDNKVRIQTFCSRTWKWEQSTLTCSNCSASIVLEPYGSVSTGQVSSGGGGAIYWNAAMMKLKEDRTRSCLVVWDINGGCISALIEPPPSPKSKFHIKYGPSPQGSLLSATCSYSLCDSINWESESFTINIWDLDDQSKRWYLLHSVRQESIWTNNLSLLKPLFKYRPPHGFTFVSFLPGKTDSVVVALQRQLFVYHFQTGKLEYVDYSKYGNFGFKHFGVFTTYYPLTKLDLGVWPSTPSSLRCS